MDQFFLRQREGVSGETYIWLRMKWNKVDFLEGMSLYKASFGCLYFGFFFWTELYFANEFFTQKLGNLRACTMISRQPCFNVV